MIRLVYPTIEEDDVHAVQDVLSSRMLVQGPQVRSFEQNVANYCRIGNAVAVSSGTAALHMSLLALNVNPGDYVIVTAYSFIATANVIELCGAKPVFIDIDFDTFNMNPDLLRDTMFRLMSSRITALKVKAVIPVHAFGCVANMPAIMEICDFYRIPVIEDAACALGAESDGKRAGTWGKCGCFSFHPRKVITTGEGGMVVTESIEVAEKLRALRNHGQNPASSTVEFVMPGYNYRMTEFQAALGCVQMSRLDSTLAIRQQLASNYNVLLAGTPVQTPPIYSDRKHIFQSYVVLLPRDRIADRAELIEKMKATGVETSIGTWHLPLANYFRNRYGYQSGDFPATDDIFTRSLALPMFDCLNLDQQKQVVDVLLSNLG
jgi:perosamine synthetase